MDWKNKAEQLKFDENKSWNEIAIEIQKEFFSDKDVLKVKDKIRNYIRNTDKYKGKSQKSVTNKENKTVTKSNIEKSTDIIEVLKKGTTLDELSETIGVSKRSCEIIIEDIKSQGYNVLECNGKYQISKIVIPSTNTIESNWNGEEIIRFGLMGDTQINSKYTQLTHLHKLYDIFEQEGITNVYHTGDIDEGEQMRMGHQYECYNQGADDHIKEIIKVYPQRKGITTKFITGNHDNSIIKRCGYDIGYAIQDKREDMQYLGNSNAVVYLTPNCTLELRHPIDGTAYALSYKMQKIIEAMQGGEKPNLLAVGHYHKAEYLFYRNVHAFQTGCFQGDTPFTRGKGISVHMGGWIVEVYVDSQGTIRRCKSEFIPFYKAIKDDYLNWK